MDLIEEILTSRYRFSRKPNLQKVLKITNIFQMILFFRIKGKFIQLNLMFQKKKRELHYAKTKGHLLSFMRYIT
jgi:hypothetical protein